MLHAVDRVESYRMIADDQVVICHCGIFLFTDLKRLFIAANKEGAVVNWHSGVVGGFRESR